MYVCIYIYIHIRTFNLLQNSGCWSETCKASKTRCAETRKATFDQEVSWKLALCERKHHVRLRALNMFIQIDICIYIYIHTYNYTFVYIYICNVVVRTLVMVVVLILLSFV